MTAMQARSHLLVPTDIKQKRALIIGAGTVGSNVAFALASIGMRDFTIVDFDDVGVHNLPSQVFNVDQIALPKSQSLADNLIARFGLGNAVSNPGGMMIDAMIGKFSPRFEGRGEFDIIISGADSMAVRKMVSMWARGSQARVVDTRCGGHEIQTWAYDAADNEQYETYQSTLYGDGEADPLPCGGEMYPVAGMVAAINTLAAVSTAGWFYRYADTERSAIS